MADGNATVAEVRLWESRVGAVNWNPDQNYAYFEYDPDFRDKGLEIAPFKMPLDEKIYSFPTLSFESFKGLPGLLADSLPDDFGNKLINEWLSRQGRQAESFNSIERLCYVGKRAMGALEYAPAIEPDKRRSRKLDVGALVELASDILSNRENFETSLSDEDSMNEILQVGTSAGGARAKAVVAWNEKTNEVRSGQVDAGAGFSYWILKLDGVESNRDKEVADPRGYGLIEFAYYLMAKDAGIEISESRLHQENQRSHFMTRRFDRTSDGIKIHMQSLAALEHFDYRMPGAYSYEQALHTIRKLGLDKESVKQQFRRMAFNIIARNQDDHVKNISFLMNPRGDWILSPAYDVTYSFNPSGAWTGQHQMTLNGKRDGFNIEDFKECANSSFLKRGEAEEIVKSVQDVVSNWEHYADLGNVSEQSAAKIKTVHRLNII